MNFETELDLQFKRLDDLHIDKIFSKNSERYGIFMDIFLNIVSIGDKIEGRIVNKLRSKNEIYVLISLLILKEINNSVNFHECINLITHSNDIIVQALLLYIYEIIRKKND